MSHSLTLTSIDQEIQLNDIVGRLNFAAPGESSGSIATRIAGSVKAIAEGDFTDSDNSTSIVFATASNGDATDKLKINSDGHFLPVADSSYDLGSDNFYFRAIYADTYYGDIDGPIVIECRNDTGSTISKGSPVYISGYYSNNGKPQIAPSNAASASTMPAIGILANELTDGSEGHVHCFGLVTQINTSSFSVGDTVYVASGGGLTNSRPTGATDLVQNIGRVLRSDASQGRILVLGPGRTNDTPNSLDVTGTITASNIGTGEDNSVVVLDSDGKLRTDEIDSRVWGGTLVDGAGTANHVAKWSDSDTLTDSVIYDDGTNVGIGTTSPQAKLDVNGTVEFDNLLRWEHPDKALDASTSTLGYIRLYDESAGYCGFGVSTSNFNIGSSGLINVRAVVNAEDRLILRTDGSNTLYYGAGKELDITKYTDAADGVRLGDIYGNSTAYQGLSHASFTSNASYMIMSEGTNTLISADTDGTVFVRGGPNYSVNEIRVYPDANGIVVNENGLDSNLRVEGVDDTHLLFCDAGEDKVSIGGVATAYKLDVHGSFSASSINVNDAYTFPTTDGSPNQILETDGSGNLSWVDSSGSGAGAALSIKSTGTQIGDSDIEVLDFSNDFEITETPDKEINISLKNNYINGSFDLTTTTSSFTVTEGYTVGTLNVYHNGIKLYDGEDFTATNGTSFTLTNAAISGDVVEYWGLNIATSATGDTTFGSITASSGQTLFSTTGYTNGGLVVFVNGVKMVNGSDFTATNGSSFTLSSAASSGDIVDYIAYGAVVASTNLQKTGDTMTGNLTVDADLIVTGYKETHVDNGNTGTSQTITITNSTLQTYTLTNNCVFTMPSNDAGRSFTIFLKTGSGSFTATFTGVKFPQNTSPTITTDANRMDIVTFYSDGTNWYGSIQQEYHV